MQPAQKRAFLAILGMLETGIHQLRQLFDDGADVLEAAQMAAPVPKQRTLDNYLNDDEDEMLEQRMEEERLEIASQHERFARQLYEDEG
jgi:hypothetical protein